MTRQKKETPKAAKLPNQLAGGKKKIIEDNKRDKRQSVEDLLGELGKSASEGKDISKALPLLMTFYVDNTDIKEEELDAASEASLVIVKAIKNEKNRDLFFNALIVRFVAGNSVARDLLLLAYDEGGSKTREYMVQKIKTIMESKRVCKEMKKNSPSYVRIVNAIARFFDLIKEDEKSGLVYEDDEE